MPRKTTVNDETVGQAVDALVQEGLDPTLERVRSKLGGGSYTTINRVLTEVLQKRQTHATQISEVPSDLVEIGQRAVAAIYAAVQRQAASKIELIETNSRKLIDAANHARAEAALEIERLESEAEQAAEALASSHRATQEALTRAERAEATTRQLRRKSSAWSARSSAPRPMRKPRGRAIRRLKNGQRAAKRLAGRSRPARARKSMPYRNRWANQKRRLRSRTRRWSGLPRP